MAVFEVVAPLIIADEGRKSNRGSDYGGLTKYGISQREYPDLNIADLSPGKALTILKRDYWDKYRCGDIRDQPIANQCFFLFVNMNPVHAASIIQIACVGVAKFPLSGMEVDGVMGPLTIQDINSMPGGWLSDRIRLEACRYYLALVDHDESQEVNFRGWIRRAVNE